METKELLEVLYSLRCDVRDEITDGYRMAVDDIIKLVESDGECYPENDFGF